MTESFRVASLVEDVWKMVMLLLEKKELQTIRLSCKDLESIANPFLFEKLSLPPTLQAMTMLQEMSWRAIPCTSKFARSIPVAKCVKILVLDLSPLWVPLDLSANPVQRRLPQIPATGTDDDYQPRPGQTLLHYTMDGFMDSVSCLTKVQSIRVETRNCKPNLDGFELVDDDPRQVFFQLLLRCRQLRGPITTFKIVSGHQKQLNMSMFEGHLHNYRNFRPIVGDRAVSKPSALASMNAKEALQVFGCVKHFEVRIYDSDHNFVAQPHLGRFRDAVEQMASHLETVKISIYTPGEAPGLHARDVCIPHQQGFISWINFGPIFGGIRFKELVEMHLYNVDYIGEDLGRFLHAHARTLKKMHVSTWTCSPNVPWKNLLQGLLARAGSALSLLTFESAPHERGELCRGHPLGHHHIHYWTLNAEKLVDLVLVYNFSLIEVLLAISRSWEINTPTETERSSLVSRDFMNAKEHFQWKAIEEPRYLAAMETLDSGSLAQRARNKVEILGRYAKRFATAQQDINDPEVVEELIWQYAAPHIEVIIINGTAGMFQWTFSGFLQFHEINKHWWQSPQCRFLNKRSQAKSLDGPPMFFEELTEPIPDGELCEVVHRPWCQPLRWKIPFEIDAPGFVEAVEKVDSDSGEGSYKVL